MPIIIISADFREMEKKIAKEVALVMDYRLLDPRILPEIELRHQIDPGRLSESMETTPSVFKKMTSRQWRYYLACIEANVFEALLKDNIVCRGLSAHLFTTGVSHAMKVRVLSGGNRNSGNNAGQKRNAGQGGGKSTAEKVQQRKKWSMAAYNLDETDPAGYDLVINLDQIDPAEAVKTITNAVKYLKFQPMTYSIKCLSDLALAAKVNVRLLKHMADIKVQARDGSVVVLTKASNWQKRKKIAAIKELAGDIEGIRYVEVHVKKNILGGTTGNSL